MVFLKMPLLLPSIIHSKARLHQPLVLFQSSLAQSSLPILRAVVAESKTKILLLCFLYPPHILFDGPPSVGPQILDFTNHIPGYCSEPEDCRQLILKCISDGTEAATHSLKNIILTESPR